MRRFLKNKLFSNALIFMFSAIFNKGINFFILPILTYYLTKDDYGMLALIMSVTTLCVVYIGLFPSNFLLVKKSSFSPEKFQKYVFHIILLIFVTFFIVGAVLYIFRDFIFMNYPQNGLLVVFIAFLALFQVFWQLLFTIIQLEKDAKKIAILQFIQSITIVGLTLLFVIKFSWGWKGKVFAEFSILMLFMFYSIYYLFKNNHIKVDFDWAKIVDIVSFLFPLTFTIVGLYLMGTIDKVFIANIITLEAAGIYAIALTMTIVINIVYDSALNAWQPYMYEYLDSDNYQDLKKVLNITYIFTLFVILSVIAYIWFSPYLFHLMIDEKFNDALKFLPILIIAYGFEGLRKPIVGFLYYVDRVKIAAFITFISAVINVILNLVLIKKYGVYGAAYATGISFFIQYVLTLGIVRFYWKSIKDKKSSLNKI